MFCPACLGQGLAGLESPAGAINRKKPFYFLSIFLQNYLEFKVVAEQNTGKHQWKLHEKDIKSDIELPNYQTTIVGKSKLKAT